MYCRGGSARSASSCSSPAKHTSAKRIFFIFLPPMLTALLLLFLFKCLLFRCTVLLSILSGFFHASSDFFVDFPILISSSGELVTLIVFVTVTRRFRIQKHKKAH